MQHICRRWLHFRFLIKSFLANTLFSYKFLIVHFNASYTSSLCFCLYTLWYPVIILITRKIGTFKYRYGFSDPMNFVPAHFQPNFETHQASAHIQYNLSFLRCLPYRSAPPYNQSYYLLLLVVAASLSKNTYHVSCFFFQLL